MVVWLLPFRGDGRGVYFVSIKKKLIIELDGTPFGRSIWSNSNMMPSEASILSHWVIRFWNNQVENDINGVILAIEFALNDE